MFYHDESHLIPRRLLEAILASVRRTSALLEAGVNDEEDE